MRWMPKSMQIVKDRIAKNDRPNAVDDTPALAEPFLRVQAAATASGLAGRSALARQLLL